MNKYSFSDILAHEIILNEKEDRKGFIKEIEIPMIQRDYAQGREDQKEVRDRFLNAIFSALKEESTLNLDFIYGSVFNKKNNALPSFIPLDGQQRLTTLFLLYWYIGNRELNGWELQSLMDNLGKFTYATRASSRRFCEKLVTENKQLSFEHLPQKEITNQPWYFRAYSKDPTIKSMLTMLNAIDEQYNKVMVEKMPLFRNLENLKFYLFPLEEFNLSDELYVKMNARGKLLTGFENFKADLTKWIKKENNPHYCSFHKRMKLDGREMTYFQSFSLKLDGRWTDFFWKIAKRQYKKEATSKGIVSIRNSGKLLIDPFFFRFFYRHFFDEYILAGMNQVKKGIDTDAQILYDEEKYQNLKIIEKLLEKETAITDIEIILDSLTLHWEDIEEAIIPSWHERMGFFGPSITQSNRVIWLAVTAFLKRFVYDGKAFREWMRVVWNIVANTDINDINSMIAAMDVVSSLVSHANCIYDYLANGDIQLSSSKLAMVEEIAKAKFIFAEPSWERAFINAESHQFFKGCISFLLSDGMTQDNFNHRFMMASKVFDGEGVNANYRKDGHIFLRAIISQISTVDDLFNGVANNKNFFVDTDEKEHYLKKMLAGNQNVRMLFLRWFDLGSEEELFIELEKELKELSSISFETDSNPEYKRKVQKVHQLLYMEEGLQNWMQEKGAIRLSLLNDHIYISRPSSWSDWVMLDSERNQVITFLLNQGFECQNKLSYCENKIEIVVPDFYWVKDLILVTGKVGEYDTEFEFDNQGTFSLRVNLGEVGWSSFEAFSHVVADENAISRLGNEIFREDIFDELIKKIH
ncbi:MAG: DUF262 domain-containing protein [Peptostreptococcaceae bacterium]|nr:DUF262 domain-containing protein [Peptostreptococcaceae bacterium]